MTRIGPEAELRALSRRSEEGGHGISGNGFIKALAVLSTCALLACANEGAPTRRRRSAARRSRRLADETVKAGDDRGASSDGRDIARANGASARAISFNHPEPHTLVIPALDLAELRGGRHALTAGGGALGGHTHLVTISRR